MTGQWLRAAPVAMKWLAREPLVHFLVAGVALFGAYTALENRRGGEAPPAQIRLTLDDLAQLDMLFEVKWRRQPTLQEFDALVEQRIREEILYREAVALGLDQDDTIVKRRMAQKMQFLAEDIAAAREPSTDELRTWFGQHVEMFAMPARLGFRHLYFAPDRRGARAHDDATEALGVLDGQPQNAPAAATLADPFMFQDYYADRTPQSIARDFGPEFAEQVAALKPGAWSGPIKSGYGWHLVFVDTVVPGRLPSFDEVENEVKTAWLGEQKAEAWQRSYEKIRARYTVLIPNPGEGAAGTASAAPVEPAAAVVQVESRP